MRSKAVRIALQFREYGRRVDGYIPDPSQALFFAREMIDYPELHNPAAWGWDLYHAMLWTEVGSALPP